jgi:uncharacterized protein YbjT (DUF2867 family)
MRVLLTGATGAIGRRLIRSLKQHGHRVFGLVRSAKSSESMLILIEMGVSPPALARTLNSSQELFGYRK